MPPRSKVDSLPQDVLDELNSRLVAAGFSGYEGFAEWLKDKGFDISKSALHRHGSALEAEFEEAMADARRTRALAKAARESGDEHDDSMLSAASEIMQDNLLRVSLKLRHSEGEPEDTAKTLSLVSRAFADIGRLDISRQKWQLEMREKLERAKLAAASEAEAIAIKAGMSDDDWALIRAKFLGIEVA